MIDRISREAPFHELGRIVRACGSNEALSTKGGLMMDDLTLKKEVEAALEWEPSLNAASIGVAVKNGIVTLTGGVSSYAEKIAAACAASQVPGVRALANELEIGLLPYERGQGLD